MPWETNPQRDHSWNFTDRELPSFYMDRHLVTNGDMQTFLDANPAFERGERFLNHWLEDTYDPAAAASKPVTHVSIEDARQYCSFYGKRLPREWEWQLAAQGRDSRVFPWGNAVPVPGEHVPVAAIGRDISWDMVPDVDSHPSGASPFGVESMVGSLWQWTDEYRDEHTRGAVLRGGSFFHPEGRDQWGDNWFFPGARSRAPEEWSWPYEPWQTDKWAGRKGAYALDTHAKWVMLSESYDRSGTVGFRCVVDTVADTPVPGSNAEDGDDAPQSLVSRIVLGAVFIVLGLAGVAFFALRTKGNKAGCLGNTAHDPGDSSLATREPLIGLMPPIPGTPERYTSARRCRAQPRLPAIAESMDEV
jgi:formylglycine-generating enzyme required for sulfatase activity